jgi:hypothetical protein
MAAATSSAGLSKTNVTCVLEAQQIPDPKETTEDKE